MVIIQSTLRYYNDVVGYSSSDVTAGVPASLKANFFLVS